VHAYAIAAAARQPELLELPDPTPASGQVLIDVHASSVNGFDLAVAAGMLQNMMEHRYPVILGKDFAGTVSAVGDDVSQFAPGTAVFGVVMTPYLGEGGFAERLAVDEQSSIAPVPDGLDLTVAGGLGLAGTTALDALDAARVRAGTTVLINGATGGVGALAVQYAAATGATVLATARPGEQTDFVKSLGAAHALDYTADLAGQVRAIAPGGVEAILHLAGDPTTLTDLLAEHGVLASALGFGPDRHPSAIAVMANPTPDTLTRLATDVAEARLSVPLAASYPLTEVDQALARFTTSKTGKILITCRA
jgi:NADPH:quinone reductase-like Zn-dependent oxidoreductase